MPDANLALPKTRGASFRLVKQTYSVFVVEPQGRRKWHLSRGPNTVEADAINRNCSSAAYFVPGTVNQLHTIDDIPRLRSIRPPEGMYTSAKLGKGRARGGEYYPTDIHSGSPLGAPPLSPVSGQYQPPPTYAPYPPHMNPPSPSEARTGSPTHTLNPPSWSRAGSPRPVLPHPAQLLPPQLTLRPAPQAPSQYSPRHPLDDEALRSLATGRRV